MHGDPRLSVADDRVRCRIGILVAGGGDDLGMALFARIVRRELQRRLPASDIRCFSFEGYANPEGLDGGEPLESLSMGSSRGLAELADELDCVIVGGGDMLPAASLIAGPGRELDARCPVMWLDVSVLVDPTPDEAALLRAALDRSPSVAVRDEASRRRLRGAGVDREIELLPSPALLVGRHFGQEVLDKRLEYLRVMGWYPQKGQALVVQGDGAVGRFAPALAGPIGGILVGRDDLSVVVAEIPSSAGGEEFANALSDALPGEPYRIPSEVELEDWVAAITSASGFIGTSPDGGAVAMAYGRPVVMLDLDGRFRDSGHLAEMGAALAEEVEAVPESFEQGEGTAGSTSRAPLSALLDRHLDRLAEIASAVGGRPRMSEAPALSDLKKEMALLRTAHEALSRRLAAERVIFADIAASFRPDVARLEAEVARLEQQLRRMRSRRIFRYTTPLLSLYGALRRRLGLQR